VGVGVAQLTFPHPDNMYGGDESLFYSFYIYIYIYIYILYFFIYRHALYNDMTFNTYGTILLVLRGEDAG